MSVACNNCKGSGHFYTKSGKRLDCKTCNGTGTDYTRYDTRCQRCLKTIVYPAGSPTPRFCKECRHIQLEKNCAQWGCDQKIRYQVGWDTIPDYCRRCETKRKEGWNAKTCTGTAFFSTCGKVIWSPPGKDFKFCPSCSERERAKEAEKWKTKRCKTCGGEIRYNADWTNVPDVCKSCKDAEKAKWREKQCADCGTTIKYHMDWTNVPSFCKNCQTKRKASKANERAVRSVYRKDGWVFDVSRKLDGQINCYVWMEESYDSTSRPFDNPHYHVFFPDKFNAGKWVAMRGIRADIPSHIQIYLLSLIGNL